MKSKLERLMPLIGLLAGGLAGAAVYGTEALQLGNLFEAVGGGLRSLSLSGGSGNLAAWAVVVVLSALPLGLLRKQKTENVLALLCCAEIFAMLYYLVNPGLRLPLPMLADPELARKSWGLVSGGCVLATVLCWICLRILRRLPEQAADLLPKLLFAAAAIYSILLGFGTAGELLGELQTLSQGNSQAELISRTGLMLTGLALLKLVPQLLAGYVLLLAADLTRKIEASPFEEETVALAEEIAKKCVALAKVALLLTVAGNGLQMLLYSTVATIRITADLPVLTLLLCAMLLVLCRYFRRAKAVSDDNASII